MANQLIDLLTIQYILHIMSCVFAPLNRFDLIYIYKIQVSLLSHRLSTVVHICKCTALMSPNRVKQLYMYTECSQFLLHFGIWQCTRYGPFGQWDCLALSTCNEMLMSI